MDGREVNMSGVKDKPLQKILENIWSGISPTKEECKFLLSFSETSLEAGLIRSTAEAVMRRKNDNGAIIVGQIGIDISPCPAGCKFCSFGEGHTRFQPKRLTDQEIIRKTQDFCREGDLFALYLMCMHDYDLEFFLQAVKLAKRAASPETRIWSNVGDTGLDSFREMKKAGVTGVYHVCRLGEGVDTKLKPEARLKTMQNALDAGLELFSCCEPIGPEHTPEQLVENFFIGIELGCTSHAAMRRTPVPGTPTAVRGFINHFRLAQITAVIALASFTVKGMEYVGVHEPNLLGYAAGANRITAESGANPRDEQIETSKNRGADMAFCRKALYEAGFSWLQRGDKSKIPLGLDYLKQTGSL